MAREIIKRRIGEDGVDIDCEEGSNKYFDLKDTKKTRYHQRRGFHYRETVYTFNEHSDRREYEETPLRVKNAEDEDEFIDYQRGVLKHIWIEAGRGAHYQRTRVTFDNTEDAARKTRTQRIGGVGGYIDVERIENFTLSLNRGALYQAKRVHLNNSEEEIEAMEGPCKEQEEQDEE